MNSKEKTICLEHYGYRLTVLEEALDEAKCIADDLQSSDGIKTTYAKEMVGLMSDTAYAVARILGGLYSTALAEVEAIEERKNNEQK